MRVILHADDFGYDKDTVSATIELIETGVLTSASIMATMPAAQEAIAYAAKHKQISYGVHLTYVDGIHHAKKCASSLLNEDGCFYPSPEVRLKAMMLKYNKFDIVDESLAQIDIIRQGGVNISHLDSHGHLHKFPSFLNALPIIKSQSGIERVRRVQNVFIQKPQFSLTSILNRYFDWRITHGYRSTDYFYMSANNMDTEWADSILVQMDQLPQSAIIEIGVHPGHTNNEKERWRQNEYDDIRDFAEKLRASGKHHIISWNEV